MKDGSTGKTTTPLSTKGIQHRPQHCELPPTMPPTPTTELHPEGGEARSASLLPHSVLGLSSEGVSGLSFCGCEVATCPLGPGLSPWIYSREAKEPSNSTDHVRQGSWTANFLSMARQVVPFNSVYAAHD